MTPVPFQQRLADALSRVTFGVHDVPAHQADQIQAATRETRDHAAGLAAALVAGGRNPALQFDHTAGPGDVEYVARVLVALEATTYQCEHAQMPGNPASPLPVLARLTLGRVDCHPCAVASSHLAVPDGSGPCDYCGAFTLHGQFGEIVTSIGHILVAGMGCPACSAWFRAHMAATGG